MAAIAPPLERQAMAPSPVEEFEDRVGLRPRDRLTPVSAAVHDFARTELFKFSAEYLL